jgi:hypothetical protein
MTGGGVPCSWVPAFAGMTGKPDQPVPIAP